MESFFALLGDKEDLWKCVFYRSKTLFFEVLEGLESSLFDVVFRAQFLVVIFCMFFLVYQATLDAQGLQKGPLGRP